MHIFYLSKKKKFSNWQKIARKIGNMEDVFEN